MRFFAATVALLLAASPAIAQNTQPACIKTCTSTHAVSSQCNGDETGDALDRCLCGSYLGPAAKPMFDCIKACSSSDQSSFAAIVPALCRDQLLPGVSPATVSSTTTSATRTGSPSTTSTGPQTTETTGAPKPGAAAGLTAPGFAAAGGLIVAALLL